MQFASNPVLLEGINDGAKWKAVEDLIQYEELPAIVWTQFIHTADLLSHKLSTKGLRVERLTGQTDPMSRQDIVDRFQRGDIDVIVAHPAVGKFGITLTKARTAIYCERSFNGDDYFQSLYRIKRIGTTQSPHVINLIATRPMGEENTIDHVIDYVLQFRKDQSLAITASTPTSGLIRDMLGRKEVKQ
jgi:SNF2 family DNA or RNA helicase